MRDPRLAELEFLSILAARTFGTTIEANCIVVDSRPSAEPFGLNLDEFRQMVIHLLINGQINGPATFRITPAEGGTLISTPPDRDIRDLLRGESLTVKLNHNGRLRLWTLRDELLSVRHLEPHHILLSDESWARDWEIAQMFRSGDQPISLVYCDLDNFGQINKHLSHSIGDEVMKRYLQIVKDSVKGVGEAYRGVGDEVTIILKGLDEKQGQQVAEEIRARVELAFKDDPNLKVEKKPTLSAGGSTFRSKVPPKTALEFVDALLMKRAKTEGKNKVVWECPAAWKG